MATCNRCGANLNPDSSCDYCDKPKAQTELGGEKVVIEVDQSPAIQRLQKEKQELVAEGLNTKEERDRYKNLLEQIASRTFQEDKQKILDSVKASGYTQADVDKMSESIKTPEDLETIKAMARMLESGLQKSGGVPAGKATIADVPEKYADIKSIVDQIYATLADPNASMKEKQEAEEKRKQLWRATRKGLVATLEKHKTHPRYTTSQCPKCANFMLGDKCDVCGYLQG